MSAITCCDNNEPEPDDQITLSRAELELMMERTADRAAEKAAKKALHDIGLGGETAREDVHDMISLIKGIRMAKRTIFKAMLWKMTELLILAGVTMMAVKYGINIQKGP